MHQLGRAGAYASRGARQHRVAGLTEEGSRGLEAAEHPRLQEGGALTSC
jgi:hypothetical protein